MRKDLASINLECDHRSLEGIRSLGIARSRDYIEPGCTCGNQNAEKAFKDKSDPSSCVESCTSHE